jgi:hypothetical protein
MRTCRLAVVTVRLSELVQYYLQASTVSCTTDPDTPGRYMGAFGLAMLREQASCVLVRPGLFVPMHSKARRSQEMFQQSMNALIGSFGEDVLVLLLFLAALCGC